MSTATYNPKRKVYVLFSTIRMKNPFPLQYICKKKSLSFKFKKTFIFKLNIYTCFFQIALVKPPLTSLPFVISYYPKKNGSVYATGNIKLRIDLKYVDVFNDQVRTDLWTTTATADDDETRDTWNLLRDSTLHYMRLPVLYRSKI